jgi:hypothetical protein
MTLLDLVLRRAEDHLLGVGDHHVIHADRRCRLFVACSNPSAAEAVRQEHGGLVAVLAVADVDERS